MGSFGGAGFIIKDPDLRFLAASGSHLFDPFVLEKELRLCGLALLIRDLFFGLTTLSLRMIPLQLWTRSRLLLGVLPLILYLGYLFTIVGDYFASYSSYLPRNKFCN